MCIRDSPKRPKGIKNVIPFWIDCLKNMIKRLVYIYKLVWDARPALMFILAFMAVFNGVQSIIGAYISKMLLDGLDVYKRQILACNFSRSVIFVRTN